MRNEQFRSGSARLAECAFHACSFNHSDISPFEQTQLFSGIRGQVATASKGKNRDNDARSRRIDGRGNDESTGSSLAKGRLSATVETFVRDVRHALRLMRRDPSFSFAAVATLALGISRNTAIFPVAYGVPWRPLPYPNPDRLIMISFPQQTPTF